VCGLGRRERNLLPYYSCNHRELELGCVGAPPANNLPMSAVFHADVQSVVLFQMFDGCDFQLGLII